MRPICITLYNNSVLTVFNGLLASGNNELIPPHCLRFSLCMTHGNRQEVFYIFLFALHRLSKKERSAVANKTDF